LNERELVAVKHLLEAAELLTRRIVVVGAASINKRALEVGVSLRDVPQLDDQTAIVPLLPAAVTEKFAPAVVDLVPEQKTFPPRLVFNFIDIRDREINV